MHYQLGNWTVIVSLPGRRRSAVIIGSPWVAAAAADLRIQPHIRLAGKITNDDAFPQVMRAGLQL